MPEVHHDRPTAAELRAGQESRLVRVGRIIARSDVEVDEILARTADAIHELLGYANVELALLEEGEPPRLVLRARGGGYKQIGRVDHLPLDRGVMGAAVREAKTQFVDDVAADPRYVQPPSGFEVQRELAVPIVHDGRVLGVVHVEGDQELGARDVEVLEFVADHLGLAIERRRLYDDARRLAILEERQRLARELHDSVTQLLFSANLTAESLAAIWERDREEARRRLERLREQVRQALAEMRALLKELAPKSSGRDFSSRELPPPAVAHLHREGLVAVLVKEALAVEREGVRAGVRADTYVRQSREREEALLRVAQEALANVAKHAHARDVEIVLACSPSEVRLTVRDDGCGFAAAPAGGSGLGLGSMRHRLRELAGKLRIVSAPGVGTTIEATLPR